MFLYQLTLSLAFFMEMPVAAVRNGSGSDFTCHVVLNTSDSFFVENNFITCYGCFVEEVGKAVRIELIRQVGRTGITETVVVVEVIFPALPFLGSDQDYTEGST